MSSASNSFPLKSLNGSAKRSAKSNLLLAQGFLSLYFLRHFYRLLRLFLLLPWLFVRLLFLGLAFLLSQLLHQFAFHGLHYGESQGTFVDGVRQCIEVVFVQFVHTAEEISLDEAEQEHHHSQSYRELDEVDHGDVVAGRNEYEFVVKDLVRPDRSEQSYILRKDLNLRHQHSIVLGVRLQVNQLNLELAEMVRKFIEREVEGELVDLDLLVRKRLVQHEFATVFGKPHGPEVRGEVHRVGDFVQEVLLVI